MIAEATDPAARFWVPFMNGTRFPWVAAVLIDDANPWDATFGIVGTELTLTKPVWRCVPRRLLEETPDGE